MSEENPPPASSSSTSSSPVAIVEKCTKSSSFAGTREILDAEIVIVDGSS
ncbi:AAEL014043-PA [Aedes aegypti]|uniref:AAEL014043-PA n=1 Tax=Aedes aegypti TaxID=7159 RepID=Q16HF2_AEDAE|nr:AAEL014043-PA [Aedes aegypti]